MEVSLVVTHLHEINSEMLSLKKGASVDFGYGLSFRPETVMSEDEIMELSHSLGGEDLGHLMYSELALTYADECCVYDEDFDKILTSIWWAYVCFTVGVNLRMAGSIRAYIVRAPESFTLPFVEPSVVVSDEESVDRLMLYHHSSHTEKLDQANTIIAGAKDVWSTFAPFVLPDSSWGSCEKRFWNALLHHYYALVIDNPDVRYLLLHTALESLFTIAAAENRWRQEQDNCRDRLVSFLREHNILSQLGLTVDRLKKLSEVRNMVAHGSPLSELGLSDHELRCYRRDLLRLSQAVFLRACLQDLRGEFTDVKKRVEYLKKLEQCTHA